MERQSAGYQDIGKIGVRLLIVLICSWWSIRGHLYIRRMVEHVIVFSE